MRICLVADLFALWQICSHKDVAQGALGVLCVAGQAAAGIVTSTALSQELEVWHGCIFWQYVRLETSRQKAHICAEGFQNLVA